MSNTIINEMAKMLTPEQRNKIAMEYARSPLAVERASIAYVRDDEALDLLIRDSDFEVRMCAASIGRPVDLNLVMKDKSKQVRSRYVANADMTDASKFINDKDSSVVVSLIERKDQKINSAILEKLIKGDKFQHENFIINALSRSSDVKIVKTMYKMFPSKCGTISSAIMYEDSEELLELIIAFDTEQFRVDRAKKILERLLKTKN